MKPKFFRTQAEFSAYLQEHHDTATQLWVGLYKTSSGRPSITWPEAVDVALCQGWIDGVRKGIDDESYMNRFTPRRVGSNWSARNIKRARELIDQGLMRPAGLEAFEARKEDRSGPYSYEQRQAASLDPGQEKRFRRNKRAWAYFESCAPSYRKAAIHWVVSAKRDETRERRLATLIADSAKGRPVPPLTPRKRQP